MGSSGGFNKAFIAVVALVFVLCAVALIVAIVLFVKINNTTAPPTQMTLPMASISGGPLPPKPSLTTTTTTPAAPTTTQATSNASGWQAVASMLAHSIDMSVDPCQNFYQFACGNWIRSHQIPNGRSSAISFGVLQNQIISTLTQIFLSKQNVTIPATNVPAVLKAQQLWNGCMNKSANNYNGSQIILGYLNAYGNWPMITPGWSKMTQSLGWLMGHFSAMYGVNTFINPYTDTNWKKPTSGYLMLFDQASLSMPLTYYTTPAIWNKTRPNLIIYIKSVAQILANDTNNPFNATQVAHDAAAMVDMEYMIANKMSVPVAKQRDYTKQYNLYNYAQLSTSNAWGTAINWADYFSQLGLIVPRLRLKAMPFSIAEPSYMDAFSKWAPSAQANQPRLFQNYMLWRLISPQLEFLPGAYRDAYASYQRDVHNVDNLMSNRDQCSSSVLNKLGYATSRLYVDNYWNKLPGNPRMALSKMIDTVKTAFSGMLQGLPWMDSSTKASAQAKIVNLVKNVAYPNWMMNDTQLNNYYQALAFSPQDDVLLLMWKSTKFQLYKSYSTLSLSSVDRTDFSGAPAIVNAWYQPELNSITFPAGILNPPFFDPQYPRSINYGGLGVVMGHELTHGFDDQGVQWNGTGFLNPWIDPYSSSGFKKMAQCVIDEYSGFCFPPSYKLNPSCISGQRTQGENIADNGGIKSAWSAYQTLNKNHGMEPRLPGWMSQFSHDQLFFMSFAQVWCRNIKQSALQGPLLTDPHSPARFRVKGTVENVPQFGQAFNCPANSPMTPAKHCTVW